MIDLKKLEASCNDKIRFLPHSENLYQIVAPYYHEDGDMIDIFLKQEDDGSLVIHDMGMSIFKLSYYFDMDSERKEKIFEDIARSNLVENNNGKLSIKTGQEGFLENLNRICLAIGKITNMEILNEQTIASMFIENVEKQIGKLPEKFIIERNYSPISGVTVDFVIRLKDSSKEKRVFVFPVKNSTAALRVAVDCYTLKEAGQESINLAVCENIEELIKADRSRLMTAVDSVIPNNEDLSSLESRVFKLAA